MTKSSIFNGGSMRSISKSSY